MKFCLSPVLVFLCVYSAAQAPATKEPAKCSVEGQVVQEPGSRPLRKANLELTPVDHEEGTKYSTTSDAEGHFKIENIEAGRYDLTVERNGFSSARHNESRTLTLDPGQDLKDIIFRLQPAAVVTGKIVDSDGDPAPQVMVVAERYTASGPRKFGRSAQTNDLGEYRISDLQPGRYLIKATPTNSSERLGVAGNGDKKLFPYSTYYPGTAEKKQSVALDLRAGEEMPANFALVYGSAFRIRGTVARASALENPGYALMLQNDSEWPRAQYEIEIKKDGSFEARDIPSGSYLVLLSDLMGGGQGLVPASEMIEVKDADIEHVRLTPASVGQVHGQLRMDTAQKKDWASTVVVLGPNDDEAKILMQFQGSDESTVQANRDGTFELKAVPSGNYQVLVFSGPSFMRDCFVKSINAGGKDIADSGFRMSGGAWSLDITISSNGARLEGVVIDDKQQPVADAEVVLIPEARRQKRRDLYQQGTTDQHGQFILRGLNPGEYTVMALEDIEDDYREPDFLKAREGMGQTVKLDEGQHVSISLKLAPSETGQH